MLDSPVALPWDLSAEMASYVRKLQHVSANCRLSDDEELMLLKHCVCDPDDRRFDDTIHSIYSVLLCKNRRSALRAHIAAADGTVVECAVALPPRPVEWGWIYQWQPQMLHTTQAQLDAFLPEVAMKYNHTRTLQLDGMLSMLTMLNTKGALPAGVSLATGGFLVLYNMLQGATQCRVHSSNCSQSFATLLLAFYPDLKDAPLLG